MLYFRLDEITSFQRHAGGPGVIAPDGTVRGQISAPGRGKPLEVTFNLLADPIIINRYMDPQAKTTSPIERLQELARTDARFAAMVASPESLFVALMNAAQSDDTLTAALLFVPGSLGKLIGQPDRDNLNVLTIVGLDSLKGVVLGEKVSESVEGGVTRCSYNSRKGDKTSTQEFELHGNVWLALP
jgi:hypothetical protein